jgi:hypothetical protein
MHFVVIYLILEEFDLSTRLLTNVKTHLKISRMVNNIFLLEEHLCALFFNRLPLIQSQISMVSSRPT